MNGADLAGSTLKDGFIEFADAESTVFRNSQAARVSFYGANLRGADFSNADLRGASFLMADLRGARLDFDPDHDPPRWLRTGGRICVREP